MTKLNLKELRRHYNFDPTYKALLDWIGRAQRLLERWEEVDGDRDCYCEAQFPETCQPCLRKKLLAELEEA